MKEAGHNIVITHGNGPQVGNIIAQNEAAKNVIEPIPIYICNAESQGFIGYILENSLKNHINERGIATNVVTLLTMVEVDKEDQAFENPTKLIGVFFSKEEAKRLEEKGIAMLEDAGRGYRRVVPSPEPQVIHGIDEIRRLIDDTIVISSVGGGIPVYREDTGQLQGIEAAIDKDRSGLKLAQQVHAEVFMMLTVVPNVYINFGKENEQKLSQITITEAER